ncbi:hypothetical protein HDU67_006586 [Dinochytrium kinnereticum]|nr:hypothetical protein HDU67_006586 [Dinochytrium kinnereticum]
MSYDSNSTTSTATFNFEQWTDLTVKFNLTASSLSAIASGAVLVIMALSPRARTSGNLARGSDLATFALAVVTFLVAQSASNIESLARRLQQVESSAIWMAIAICLVPVATATIGYMLVGMGVAGSWCWFNRDPRPLATYVRYSLTHGPRIFIIFSIVMMYTILFWAFRVRIRQQEHNLSRDMSSSKSTGSFQNNSGTWDEERAYQQIKQKADAQRNAIMKLLIYPTAFTLLWIPGLVNRFAEASGQTPETLAITSFFQFTTQLVGFANSVIYGYSRFFGKQGGAF